MFQMSWDDPDWTWYCKWLRGETVWTVNEWTTRYIELKILFSSMHFHAVINLHIPPALFHKWHEFKQHKPVIEMKTPNKKHVVHVQHWEKKAACLEKEAKGVLTSLSTSVILVTWFFFSRVTSAASCRWVVCLWRGGCELMLQLWHPLTLCTAFTTVAMVIWCASFRSFLNGFCSRWRPHSLCGYSWKMLLL